MASSARGSDSADLRREDQSKLKWATKEGLWRVESGSLKERLGAEMGRSLRPTGTCELNFFLPRRGLPAMKAVGVRMVRSASEKLD